MNFLQNLVVELTDKISSQESAMAEQAHIMKGQAEEIRQKNIQIGNLQAQHRELLTQLPTVNIVDMQQEIGRLQTEYNKWKELAELTHSKHISAYQEMLKYQTEAGNLRFKVGALEQKLESAHDDLIVARDRAEAEIKKNTLLAIENNLLKDQLKTRAFFDQLDQIMKELGDKPCTQAVFNRYNDEIRNLYRSFTSDSPINVYDDAEKIGYVSSIELIRESQNTARLNIVIIKMVDIEKAVITVGKMSDDPESSPFASLVFTHEEIEDMWHIKKTAKAITDIINKKLGCTFDE